MKYSISINQVAVFEHGLADKTDLVDWAIVDYVKGFQLSPKAKKWDDLVWIDYKHLIAEMPLIKLKSKSSISNRIKKLVSLNLLSTCQDEECKLYAKITELCHSIVEFKAVYSEEHPVPENEHPVHSEEHPVPENEHRTDNYLSDNYILDKRKGYAFCGEKIKVNQKDFEDMKIRYKNLDLMKELAQLDLELREEKKYWMVLQAKLNYRNKIGGNNATHQPNRKLTPAEQSEQRDEWYRQKHANKMA